VNTRSTKEAYNIKDNINSFLQMQLFPRLEELLKDYFVSDRILRLERLNVDFSVKDWQQPNTVKTEFSKKMAEKLKAELGVHKSENVFTEFESDKHTNISLKKNREDIFLFFLKNGYLPWYGRKEHIAVVLEEDDWNRHLADEAFRANINKILKTNPEILQRFIIQIPFEAVFNFLLKENDLADKNRPEILSFLELLDDSQKTAFLYFYIKNALFTNINEWLPDLKTILLMIYSNKKDLRDKHDVVLAEKLEGLINKTVHSFHTGKLKWYKVIEEFKDSPATEFFGIEKKQLDKRAETTIIEGETELETGQSNISSEETWKDSFFKDDENEINVHNAGIILIHPFIKTFFQNLGFLNSEGQMKNERKEIAVQTLYFVNTGVEDFFEGHMLFEKFLCGVPLHWPIQRKSLLNENIKQEANTLLKEVIKNWPALKNTSPDGVRQMFFHRDGKLAHKEKRYKLVVEHKAQDVLLEKLHWNIAMVKLPWMKEMLFVEW